ncbi:hypothetical protein [Faucicola atlantae]|uniref:hypothetical protein n=1 Tax=Faucicola atlantae TaxID=34059 RepID=UPI0025AEDFED|nr:hypothetical protein [Moraxella atlantae]
MGKVIYLSNYFKDMMGFLYSIETFTNKEDIYNLKNLDEIEFAKTVFYTSKDIIEKGSYELLNYKLPVTDSEVKLTKRIVANHVYQLDENLGFCNTEQADILPIQGYGGYAYHIDVLNNL